MPPTVAHSSPAHASPQGKKTWGVEAGRPGSELLLQAGADEQLAAGLQRYGSSRLPSVVKSDYNLDSAVAALQP